MAGLERLRLRAKRTEASSLLPVASADLVASLGAEAAWWICHDEGDVDAMVSIVGVSDDEWFVERVELAASGDDQRTDAEALARVRHRVFVFGSSFVNKHGTVDERRSFIARFDERVQADERLTFDADVLDLRTLWNDLFATAAASIELLPSKGDQGLVNVEGAGFIGDDLVLGLRWPVSVQGQPLLMRVVGATGVLDDGAWSTERLRNLTAELHAVDVGATPKRPAGVRGLSVVDDDLHLVTGQTERSLAADKAKAAPAQHVRCDAALATAEVEERFEGFRKVEGLAPLPQGGWLYALDDEDAVVLVTSHA